MVVTLIYVITTKIFYVPMIILHKSGVTKSNTYILLYNIDLIYEKQQERKYINILLPMLFIY